MHYFGFNDYMMKVVDVNEVVLSCYVDIFIGFQGLWSYDRFTKYV